MESQKTNEVGGVFWGLAVNVLRFVVGTLLFAVFWYLSGWALASEAVGIGLVVFCFGIAPWVAPDLIWIVACWSGRLRAVHYGLEPFLARCYLNGILHSPGLRPALFVRAGTDEAFFWFERLGGRSQTWIVTDAWMRLPPMQRKKDWELRWARQIQMGRGKRWLRSLQIRLWIGAILPLELLVVLAQFLLSRLESVRGIPSLGFWAQRFCWTLKSFWFGDSGEPDSDGLWVGASKVRPGAMPKYWESLALGVWAECPSHRAHWLWGLLTHPSAMEPKRS
jgi:hypothetical protein